MKFAVAVIALLSASVSAFSPTFFPLTKNHRVNVGHDHDDGSALFSSSSDTLTTTENTESSSSSDRNEIIQEPLNVGPKPTPKAKVVLPSRDLVKEEQTARALLKAQLQYSAAARPVPNVGPKPTPKVKLVLPPRDLVKDEQTARALLKAQLEYTGAARPVPDVGPKPTPKVKLVLPPRDPVKQERTARALLQAQLECTAAARPVPDVGPKPTPKVKRVLPPRDPVKQEQTARALLTTRMELEVAARTKLAQERAAREAQKAAELARVQEGKQRLILKSRLDVMAEHFAVQQAEKAVIEARKQAIRTARQQPKDPAEEEALATKYGAAKDLEERAFAILVDLGMVEVTPEAALA